MTESPHYTDHLITALRCLSDHQLARLAEGIFERVKPSKEMDERWFHEAIRQRSEKDQWKACAQRLEARLNAMTKPIKCKLTMEERLEYVAKLKLDYAQQDEFEKRVTRNLEP
jgi:hypothetical protein